MLIGVHSNNDIGSVLKFERWLGRPVDLVSQHTGEGSTDDFRNSAGWFAWGDGQLKDLPRAVVWSVPMLWQGVTLAQAASGACDDAWRSVAQTLAGSRPRDAVIYVRLGWEHNGGWMKWAAKGQETPFIGAFQRQAGIFRQVSNRYRIIWCPNIGQNDPALSWPGPDHVDLIGMDFYHQPQDGDPADPGKAWAFMRTRTFGLDWLTAFAARQRKPICPPEVGIRTDGMGAYLEACEAWCRANGVVFLSYWDSDADYPGTLSGGRYPASGEAFRACFGRCI